MGVVYRRRGRNIAWAVVDGSLLFGIGVAIISSVEPASRSLWLAPGLFVGGMVLVVRCLRRNVSVDETGMSGRSAIASWFVA